MSGWTWVGAFAVLALAAMLVLRAFGRARWTGLTRELETRLLASRQTPRVARYHAAELEGLPAPVQRFFRAVLSDGQPIVTGATLRHAGRFNLGETTDRWVPFTSQQRVVTQRPGFVWDARMPMAPGLVVHVHDAYVDGQGLLRPAIAGLFTLTELRGGGDIAVGELMRFFAEAAWYPTALLPSQGVRWQAVDERSARATLVDGPVTLTLTFGFDADGLLATVRADARGRTVGGRSVPTPWEGRWSGHQRLHGMVVPMRGEVAWLLPEGDKPYWRGTVTALEHEFAR
jgi:hypothetical protein